MIDTGSPCSGVTVVVPTLNRGNYLIDTLTDLLAQSYGPMEILIVDQSENIDPALDSLVRHNPGVIVHHRVDFRSLPVARNYGWQMARNDIVIYVDDDIRCGPSLISEHVRTLLEDGVGLSAGGIEEAKGESAPTSTGTFNPWFASVHRGFNAHGKFEVDHVPGGNFGAWKRVLVEVGGVDEGFGTGSALLEETEFALRVKRQGHKILFNGAARITHLAAGSGGTRQPNMVSFVRALAHNRSILIRRNSLWYQWPTALGYTMRLIMAYAFYHRQFIAGVAGLRGMLSGWVAGGNPVAVTAFEDDVEK